MANRPKPQRLTRAQLSSFLGSPELIRAFESYIKAIAELTPDEIEDIQQAIPSITASLSLISAHAEELERQQDDQLTRLAELQASINQLREETNMGQKIRRVVSGQIFLTAGVLTNSTVISPAIVGPAELRMLGVTTDATTFASSLAIISRSGSTISAERSASSNNCIVNFEVTEYMS